MWHFFGPSYRKISGSNQVKNSFCRISNISVPCPHAQLRGRTVIKKLWTFFGPWGRDRSQSPLCWIFRVKQIHPSTASEWTTRQEVALPIIFPVTCPSTYPEMWSYFHQLWAVNSWHLKVKGIVIWFYQISTFNTSKRNVSASTFWWPVFSTIFTLFANICMTHDLWSNINPLITTMIVLSPFHWAIKSMLLRMKCF